MSVVWCHGINTNAEDRLKHRKVGYPWCNFLQLRNATFFSTFVFWHEQNEHFLSFSIWMF